MSQVWDKVPEEQRMELDGQGVQLMSLWGRAIQCNGSNSDEPEVNQANQSDGSCLVEPEVNDRPVTCPMVR